MVTFCWCGAQREKSQSFFEAEMVKLVEETNNVRDEHRTILDRELAKVEDKLGAELASLTEVHAVTVSKLEEEKMRRVKNDELLEKMVWCLFFCFDISTI